MSFNIGSFVYFPMYSRSLQYRLSIYYLLLFHIIYITHTKIHRSQWSLILSHAFHIVHVFQNPIMKTRFYICRKYYITVLGSFLFLLFINDISNFMTEGCVTNLFVVDAMIYASGDSVSEVKLKLFKLHHYIVLRESSKILQQQI